MSDSEAGKAVAEASERRNEAKKALDTAEVYAKNSQDLAALNAEIEELKKEGMWFVCADMGGTQMQSAKRR